MLFAIYFAAMLLWIVCDILIAYYEKRKAADNIKKCCNSDEYVKKFVQNNYHLSDKSYFERAAVNIARRFDVPISTVRSQISVHLEDTGIPLMEGQY